MKSAGYDVEIVGAELLGRDGSTLNGPVFIYDVRELREKAGAFSLHTLTVFFMVPGI